MNALIKAPLDGEVIAPGEMVSVYGTTHPLNAVAGARIHCRVAAGLSIAEVLAEALSHKPGWNLRRDLIVKIGDHEIPEGNWSRVRVKEGATVTFIPRLQGGNALKTVLSLVVAVAAFVFAGPIAGSLGLTIAGFAISGTALSIATAVVAGGIMLAGTLALNALFPVRPPEAPESINSTALNSVQGAQNQANPFGAVPVVLGTHRQSPYFAAKPYTEIVGDDQYLHLLVCWGYGPQSVPTDLKIGETLLSSFTDYQIEHRQGFAGDAPLTLYPGTVDEQALSITLTDPHAPGTQGPSDDWETRTTAVDTDAISIDITAPEGIFRVNDKTGNMDAYSVSVEAQYAIVGTGLWTPMGVVTFTRSTSPKRKGIRFGVDRGQFDVRVRKFTPDANSDKTKDRVVWTALRSISSIEATRFPKPLALTALFIKATDQVSGVINTLNGVTSSLVTGWNGATWGADTQSNNPADIFRWVLQGPANARPVADSQIDLTNLQEWHAYCVNNGFAFNQVINSPGSVYDKLADIAAAARGVPTFIDGKWGVIWDRPDDSIVQHFTPRNSWGFQGQKPYVQQPHGWRASFINEDNGYTLDERIVYDDGYDATNATLFEGIEFPGVTDPDLIWKHGRFHIAQSRLRPEKITLSVGWEHLVCTRGDRVRVTHDVLLVGLASGRVKSVAGQVVTFDEEVTLEDGQTYGFQFRVPEDARSINRTVDATTAGDYTSLTLVGDLSLIVPGTLFGFGLTEQESAVYRVQGITHQKDLIATLTLVDDAPDISTADSGTIPAYTPNVTIPADPFTLPPRDLKYQEVIDGVGASVRALVRLTWQVPRFGNISTFEVQARDDDTGGDFVTVDSVPAPRTTADVPLIASGVWSFRVRCIFDRGQPSDWASLIGINFAGLTSVPGDITNLHQKAVDGQTVLDWDAVTDQRTINYEVRKGTSWDTSLVVGDIVTQPPWPTTGDGTYHVRAYVLSPFGTRIYSTSTASITIADSIISRNIILSKDEQADGWTGGLEGGVITGSFIRTDSGLTIAQPWAQEVVDTLALSGTHIAVYVSSVVVDIGRAAECRFWTEFEASGVLQGADWLAPTDILNTIDILGSSPTRNIRAFPIWRFAPTGSNDVFTPTDIFSPSDIFNSGDIDWLDWVAIASGTRVSRYFRPGYVLITDSEDTDGTGTKFRWFVDVPDRTDDYTELTVPSGGLDVTFYSGGYHATATPGADAVPFNGGPNGSDVPHVQRAIVDGTNGDEVKITNLTLSGCTVHVVNAGSNVTRSGVNLLIRGY